ncbi:hypothetical protein IT570_06290 [Candidatus Sumerlaeota bacterium]|nr:hypothetical protein [Candidatus Sumerlaeota bacterium]
MNEASMGAQLPRRDWQWAAALIALAAIPRLAAVPIGSLNMHAARDIFRTLNLISLQHVPLTGSELYFGGAVPGNFYFFLSAIPLILWKSPYAIMAWIGLLTSLAAGITYLALRMVMQRPSAIAACVSYALFPQAFVENLWMWNPSYLPFLSSIALWGLCYWIKFRSGAGLALMLTMGLLGIQVHLSAYAIFIAGLFTYVATLLVEKVKRSPGHPTRNARLLHLLIPFIVALPFSLPALWWQSEFYFVPLKSEQVAKQTSIGLLNPAINPYAFATIGKAFTFQDDTLARQEFLNFQRFLDQLPSLSPGLGKFCSKVAPHVSSAGQAPFALIGGALLCFAVLGRKRPGHERLLQLAGLDAESARPFAFAILLWFLVPCAVLIKTLGDKPHEPLGIPTRYIVILFPIAMIFVGLGFGFLMGWLRERMQRGAVLALFIAGQATHALIITLFIIVSVEKVSVFKATMPLNYTKPLFMEKRLCDFMVDEHNVSLDDFRERFFSDSNFIDFNGEQFLNFELWKGKGGTGADQNKWFYLYDSARNPQPPRLVRESGPVVDELRVGQFRLLVIQRDDPSVPVIWPKSMLEPSLIY